VLLKVVMVSAAIYINLCKGLRLLENETTSCFGLLLIAMTLTQSRTWRGQGCKLWFRIWVSF
jgi:uncharacterized membrane protein